MDAIDRIKTVRRDGTRAVESSRSHSRRDPVANASPRGANARATTAASGERGFATRRGRLTDAARARRTDARDAGEEGVAHGEKDRGGAGERARGESTGKQTTSAAAPEEEKIVRSAVRRAGDVAVEAAGTGDHAGGIEGDERDVRSAAKRGGRDAKDGQGDEDRGRRRDDGCDQRTDGTDAAGAGGVGTTGGVRGGVGRGRAGGGVGRVGRVGRRRQITRFRARPGVGGRTRDAERAVAVRAGARDRRGRRSRTQGAASRDGTLVSVFESRRRGLTAPFRGRARVSLGFVVVTIISSLVTRDSPTRRRLRRGLAAPTRPARSRAPRRTPRRPSRTCETRPSACPVVNRASKLVSRSRARPRALAMPFLFRGDFQTVTNDSHAER